MQRPPMPTSVQDPICGMTLDPTHAHASRVLDSETMFFCSQHCVKQFEHDHTVSATTGTSDVGMLRRIELPVTGLHDQQGITYLEEQLKALPGITQATANSKSSILRLTYDPKQTSVAAIVDRIRTVGYTAGMATLQIAIEGMHCSTCTVTIEDALQQIQSVLSATVNPATGLAHIEYLPSMIDRIGLAYAIEEAGYQIREEAAPTETALDRAAHDQTREYRTLLHKFWFAALVSVPVIINSAP